MISFENAKVLSYNQQNDFWGNSFRFSSKKELTVEGSVYNLANTSGVSGIWSGISGFENADDYNDVIIAGANFGRGRINSFEFRNGNDVRKKDYSVNITIFDSGNLFNLTGLNYSGLDLNNTNHPAYLLENFSENFDFNLTNDGSYNYKQTVTSRFVSGGAIGSGFDPIQMSKDFASGLLHSSPIFGLTGIFNSGLYNQNGRRLYSESYNLITNECSFTESLDLDKSSGNYSLKYTHEIITDENGVSTINENGEIKGLVEDYNSAAESGYLNEINSNSFIRAQELLSVYLPSGAYPLINSHLNLKKTVNKFDNSINYSISYSNNPNLNQDYIWEYIQQIEKTQDGCFYNLKEDGKIKGIYPCTFSTNPKEIDAWNSIRSGISDRINDFYQNATNATNTLKIIATSRKHSPLSREIDYSFSYTDDLRYSDSGFKRIDVNVSDRLPIHLVNKFGIINVKEIVQPTNISKESNREVSIKIIGERGTLLTSYLDKSKMILNSLIPSGDDAFVNACKYSLSPNDNTFNLNLGWVYFGERDFEDVLV